MTWATIFEILFCIWIYLGIGATLGLILLISNPDRELSFRDIFWGVVAWPILILVAPILLPLVSYALNRQPTPEEFMAEVVNEGVKEGYIQVLGKNDPKP